MCQIYSYAKKQKLGSITNNLWWGVSDGYTFFLKRKKKAGVKDLIAVEIVDPRVAIGTYTLTRPPLTDISFMLELAFVFSATCASCRSIRKLTSQHGRVEDGLQGHGVTHPVDQLLAGDEIDVG